MVQDLVKEILLEHLGPLKKTPKGWLRRNCMLCHLKGESADTKGRFGVLFSPDGKIAVNCFNCGYDAVFTPGHSLSAKFQRVMSELGISQYDIQKLNFELFKEQNSLEADSEIKLRGVITKNWTPKSLPPNSRSILDWLTDGCTDPNFMRVAEYAVNRRFRKLDELFWTPDKEFMFHKRLTLPFYYKNEIVGYTGRYFGEPPNKKLPKYINQMPDNYIYNLSKQADFDRKYVILCEGVFDAYFTDGVSPCHSTMNEDQIQMLNSLGKIIIVCPDKDKDGGTLVNIAIKNGWRVAFPDWGIGIKDPAKAVEKFGRILTIKSIIDSSERNPTTIELKWKLDKNERHTGVYQGS
jgi:hypothetical protein